MRNDASTHMRIASAHACDAECYATQRNATERKSSQDMGENRCFSYAPDPVDNSKSRINQERLDEFIRLDRAGMTARQIAEQMHVTMRTVTRWRTRAGANRGPVRARTPDELREQARAILADGGSFTEAAETIGVRSETVKRWFPDIPAWTKSQAGAYAVLVRRLNKVA